MQGVLTTIKRAMFGFVAAALCLSATGAAHAAAPFYPAPSAQQFHQSSPIVGVWVHTDVAEGRIYGLAFDDNGNFMMAIGDAEGNVLSKMEGQYVYADGAVTLIYQNHYQTIQVYPVSTNEFIDGGGDTWTRA